MVEGLTGELAVRLRLIAEQIKKWEARDLQDQRDRGEKKLSRPAYFHDLQEMAAMLEGNHREFKLTASRGAGRPPDLTAVDRDMEIARLVHRHQLAGGKVKDGLANAVRDFNVSDKTAEAAWRRFKGSFDSPVVEKAAPYFEKLRLRGLVTITRVKNPKK